MKSGKKRMSILTNTYFGGSTNRQGGQGGRRRFFTSEARWDDDLDRVVLKRSNMGNLPQYTGGTGKPSINGKLSTVEEWGRKDDPGVFIEGHGDVDENMAMSDEE